MRYLALAVFGCLGTLFFFGGMVAGLGVHDSGNTLVGTVVAALGIGLLVVTHNIARDLHAGPFVRGSVKLLFGLGSMTLVTGLIGVGMRVFAPSAGDEPFFSTNFVFMTVFGGLCVGALVLAYRDSRASPLKIQLGSNEH